MTPSAPYGKLKSLGSGGSMVARLKLKGIDGRAPPGVNYSSTRVARGPICPSLDRAVRNVQLVLLFESEAFEMLETPATHPLRTACESRRGLVSRGRDNLVCRDNQQRGPYGRDPTGSVQRLSVCRGLASPPLKIESCPVGRRAQRKGL